MTFTLLGTAYFIAACFVGLGILLFVIGNRALRDYTQSADVRAGGYLLNLAAAILCGIGIIIFLLLG